MVVEEADPRADGQRPAGELREGAPDAGGALEDVVPGADEEDVVAAGIDDRRHAARVLSPYAPDSRALMYLLKNSDICRENAAVRDRVT